jgi:hypothetical protein
VISATATQLKIKAVNTFDLDFTAFASGPNSIAVVQVRSGGKKAVSPVIPFKRLLLLSGIFNPDYFNWSIGRPADSLVITGKGLRKSGVLVSVGSTALSNFIIDSTAENGKVTLRLPKTFFGEENDESIMVDKVVTLSNPDGKTVTKSFSFLVSPQMRVNSMQAEFPTYSKSGLNGSGGIIRINVYGRSLKSDAKVVVGAIGYLSEGPLVVGGFPDNSIIEIGPGSLPLGTYTVGIWRGNTLYNTCHFTLTQ